MSIQTYLVVINPLTGRKGNRYLQQLEQQFKLKNLAYDVFLTEADNRLTEQKLSERLHIYTDVISIGGDGTLNMLANVLAYKNTPLGIIPCGTGNDFSRHIYKKSDDVIATSLKKDSIVIDLGQCKDRYFINVLGVGYDGMLAEKTRNDKKIFFRSFFYLWNALKYLFLYSEQKIKVTTEGFNKHEDTFMAAFGNGAFFGSGMNITPHADFSDGLLDCCWVGRLSFLKKMYCLVKLYSGKHLHVDNIEYLKAQEFEVTTAGHPVEADGEFLGYTPVHIKSAGKALLLKVPD